jgi:hypothetical protein
MRANSNFEQRRFVMRMKRIGTLLTGLLMVACAATVFAAPGKGGRGSGGWGMGGGYQRMYSPATVETVSGEVISVDRITPMKGMGTGIHLQLKTDKETLSVHLGPAWYIERLDAQIEKGNTIEVKGSRVTVAGKPAIIAAEVKMGDALLTLRDNSGIPVWSGWRR